MRKFIRSHHPAVIARAIVVPCAALAGLLTMPWHAWLMFLAALVAADLAAWTVAWLAVPSLRRWYAEGGR